MSKDAQAGDRSTTSPARAAPRAAWIALASVSAALTPMPAEARAAAIRPPSSPMTTAWVTRSRAASASGVKSWPLPLPPAMRTMRSAKDSSALMVDATFVPFESL